MLIVAKLFAALLSIVVIARSIVDYKEKKESFQMTAFWVVVWLVIAGIAFFPSVVNSAIKMFGGDKTGLGTIFGMGLIFVMFISYRIYVKTNRVEKTVNEITRIISLRDIGKKIRKKNGQISKK